MTSRPAETCASSPTFGAAYFNEPLNDLIVAVDTATDDTAENIGAAHIQRVKTEPTLYAAHWRLLQATWTDTDAREADNNFPLLRRGAQGAPLDATITPCRHDQAIAGQ